MYAHYGVHIVALNRRSAEVNTAKGISCVPKVIRVV